MSDNGYAGLLAVANGWKARAETAEAERDALAAHVELLSRAAYEVCNDSFSYGGTSMAVNAAGDLATGDRGKYPCSMTALAEAAVSSPTTSLAHLKAEWDKAELQPIWETLIKVADLLGIDAEKARSLPGKPSDVYAAYLARLKAQCRRDVVTQLAEEFREAWPEHNGKHAWILGAGDEICRQAEEPDE